MQLIRQCSVLTLICFLLIHNLTSKYKKKCRDEIWRHHCMCHTMYKVSLLCYPVYQKSPTLYSHTKVHTLHIKNTFLCRLAAIAIYKIIPFTYQNAWVNYKGVGKTSQGWHSIHAKKLLFSLQVTGFLAKYRLFSFAK